MVSVLLDDFVPEGGFLRDEVAGHEVVVDAQTSPGVDGGIALLGFGELRGLPVGELLALADFLVKNDGHFQLSIEFVVCLSYRNTIHRSY